MLNCGSRWFEFLSVNIFYLHCACRKRKEIRGIISPAVVVTLKFDWFTAFLVTTVKNKVKNRKRQDRREGEIRREQERERWLAELEEVEENVGISATTYQ